MSRNEPAALDVNIPTADGLVLRGRHWRCENATAVVVVAHGFGEHGGPYERVARALAGGAGVEVLAPDLRGHGRSPGRRGVVRHYEELVSDFRATLAWAARHRRGLPLFALGHSNGGQVALRTALDPPPDAPIRGVIASNPMLRLVFPVPRPKLLLGKVLLKLAPGVTLQAPIEPSKLSRDPSLRSFYLDDPLRHGRMSAPLFFGMVEGGERLLRGVAELTTPALWIVGGADPIVDPSAARLAFDRLGSADKTLLLYPEMLHEPFHDRGREGVIADLVSWVRARIASPSGSFEGPAGPADSRFSRL